MKLSEKGKNKMIELYQRISINRDFPEYQLKKGDIATLIDIVPHPENGENGYILEVFNAIGESIHVIIIPQSSVTTLKLDENYS